MVRDVCQPLAAAPRAAKIRLTAVSHRFGADGGVLALQDVDLEVRPGELVAVVGESGCGKTTLLRLVAGLVEPTAGDITVDGQPVDGPTVNVALMFQRPVLLEWRSVLDNVLLPLEIAGRRDAVSIDDARELLRMLGLAGFDRKRPRQLSGGMQQRVALARALITRPDVLLLDEPFSALDALTREALQEELLAAWARSGATALLVTHDIVEAAFLADRIVLLTPRPGQVAQVFDVPLARRRTPEDRYAPELVALVRDVRHAMTRAGGR